MDEHFSEPEPNLIISSAGFSVQVLGQTGMRYVEGDKSVWIDSEVLAKPGAIGLYKDSIKAWGNTGSPAHLAEDDRRRIVANIGRAFQACGYELQIIG
jgi:hypothetical protein